MNYYLQVNNEQKGPYALSQIQDMWNSGTITSGSLYWDAQGEQWKPVNELIASVPPVIEQPRSIKHDTKDSILAAAASAPVESMKSNKYTNYSEVPYYFKQWFFWIMYLTVTPVALGILILGNVYYEKDGEVRSFSVANKVVAGILGAYWVISIVITFIGGFQEAITE